MARNLLGWPGAPLALTSAALFGASTQAPARREHQSVASGRSALSRLGDWVKRRPLGTACVRRRGGGSAYTPGRSALARLGRAERWCDRSGPADDRFDNDTRLVGLAPAQFGKPRYDGDCLGAFRENVDHRLLVGAAAILSGAVLLSWEGGSAGFGLGEIAIAGACVACLDNNLTPKTERRRSGSDSADQGIGCGSDKPHPGPDYGCTSAVSCRARRRGIGWLPRLRRQLGPVRVGPTPPWGRTNRCLLLYCPVHGRTARDSHVP
jgi:hypothetical protein